ncbi:AAA family ATPase [Aliarcobacter butzleri]|uniref:AAA family ATPase n=1 Tax=Aliarcobacter butzleri TaxID=28197 RepID=UPI00126A7429|nr:AAA family ATPase [Aliarcobacter butzleri]
MELVYLWVEKYKNISDKGFNFSPRFKCKFFPEYEDGKLKDDCELEITPKNCINIFPENINVSAIIGENGSGKSRILNILHRGLIDFDFRGFAIFSNQEQEIFYLECSHKDYNFLKKKYKELSDKIEFPIFNYSFTYDIYADEFNELIFPKKNYRRINGIISLQYELIKNQKNILLNYFELKRNNQLDKFKKFFIPKTINIFFDYSRIINYHQEKQTKETKDLLNRLLSKMIENRPIDDFFTISKEILNLLNNQSSYEKPKHDFDFFNPSFELGNTDDENIYFNLWHKDYFSEIDLKQYSNNNVLEVINHNDTWLSDSRLKVLSFDIDKLNEKIIKVILASFSSEYFIIQLCDTNDKKLNDLSYGEQQLIFILNQLYALSYYSPLFDKIDNFVVLLDEIELSFHPKWQKNTIGYILDFLKFIPNKKFHLIFSSHSPFILSDLPKENVIFLENGTQIYPFEDGKQTFGANIHTLLSHGFFMDGGLMGEFAEKTIQDVINYLADKPTQNMNKQKAWQIIQFVGEPFLKYKLEEKYNGKFLTEEEKKQNKIKQLEDELKRLKDDNTQS